MIFRRRSSSRQAGGSDSTCAAAAARLSSAAAASFFASSEKLKAELGWEAQVHFDEGIEKTVNWYRDNEDWWGPIRSGEYREYYERQYGKALG